MSRRGALALVLFVSTAALAEGAPSPELQLCLMHLRDGERAKLEAAVGPIEEQPLYRLELEFEPVERKVKGRVQVVRTATTRELSAMYLRVTPNAQKPQMKLSNATVNGQPAVLEQPEPTLYRVKLDPPVAPGALAIVEVLIDATVPLVAEESVTLMGGMTNTSGTRDYGAFGATADVFMLTGILPLMPPEDAVGEPWDGPSGLGDLSTAAPSQVLASITVPSGFVALGTGVALGEVPNKDGRVRFSFGAAAVRDFPVVIARGYEKQETTQEGVTIESWHSAADKKSGAKVLEYAKAAIAQMAKRLGPLPYKTFRVIQAPLTGGAGGMEFSGATVVSTALYRAVDNPSEALGLPPGWDLMLAAMGGNTSRKDGGELGDMLRETLEFTVAHEVAHQYFAGLVGSDPVKHPVIDESLAQYTALLYMEWKHGKPSADATRKQQLVGAYHMYRMGGGADGAASRPTAEFNGATEYAALVYGKAPLFHHEARQVVGEAAFNKALRAYVDQYRYRWTCESCFTDVLAKGSPRQAKKLHQLRMRYWEEAHGDEDLGKPSMEALMPGGAMPQMDAQTQQLMEQLLKGMMGE